MAANISELKDKINTKTLHFVLLSLVTYGIYTVLWLYKNYRLIDTTTKIKTANDNFILWIAICFGLSLWVHELPGIFADVDFFYGRFYDVTSIILSFITEAFYILWAFKAKTALEEYALNDYKLDLKLNPVYLLIFNTFYINYCINDLPDVQRKQQIISGKASR